MNKIVAVIVTYNRKKMLKENIESLLNQTYNNFDIVIIDNNSTDGTSDLVKKYKSERINYINTGKNLGGAGGFNFGIKKAIELKYKYAWVMDDDTIPNSDALENIVKKKEILKDNFSFLGSVVKWTNNELCVMNKQYISNLEMKDIELLKNGILKIKNNSFVSCFINLNIAKIVGLPYKEFFIYGDDLEYTLRLSKKKSGFLITDSVVVHKMKTNEGIDIVTAPKERIGRYYYNFRNNMFINRKLSKKSKFINILKNIYLIFKVLFKSKKNKFKRIAVIIKGTICGLLFNPQIEYL